MDQEEYYITSSPSHINSELNFEELLINQEIEFLHILNQNNYIIQDNNSDYNNMKDHIKNLHDIIFNYIKLKGVNNKFIFKLREEINNYKLTTLPKK